MSKNTQARTHNSQLLIGVLISLALLLAGCSISPDNGSQLAADQTFVWPLTHATSFNDLILDPANAPDAYSQSVMSLLYSGLVTTDRDLNVVPDLAASWSVSPDGLEYTFSLKPHLQFSDGSPLTAQDFAYSLDRVLNPQTCVPIFGSGCQTQSQWFLDIVGAADRLAGSIPSDINVGLFALDAQTLLIKLAHPAAYFLEALATTYALPVERSFIQKYGQDYQEHIDWTHHLDQGGSSGPFMLQSYGDGKTLTFVPNPYWSGPKLTLKRVIRPIVPDLTDAYTAYLQGKYDYVDVPPQYYDEARDQGDFHEIGILTEQFMGLNELAPPFTDLDVRQAFALAVNKQLIADKVLDGSALPTNHIIPQGEPGFFAGLTAPGGSTRAVTGDFDKAQKLISDYFSQCSCSSLTVTLTYPDDAKRSAVAQAIIPMWQTVLSGPWGQVHVIPNPMSFQELLYTDIPSTIGHAGPLQIWLIGYAADYPDPFVWLNSIFAPNAYLNAFNYHDDTQFAAWVLMQQANTEQNVGKRLALYNQAEQQLVNAAVEIPYDQEKGIWRIKPYVQGFNPSALQTSQPLPALDWANVKILVH
jgi:oligopeptide transport system substrate-binding protein